MDQNTYIEQAAAHFRTLLTEQLNRQARMAQGSPAKDFSRMERIVIGLIPGDGIGPILMAQARRVLEKLLAAELAVGRVELRDIEGLTIENRTAQGKAIPDEVLASIKDCDVLLKGPTETPKGGTLESANVAMRRELDLFANVRPVSVPKLGIDWTFFRENTEGEYALGSRGVEVPGMLSMDFKVTTDAGTRRIAKAAFDFARANGKTNVAIVTKANIMKKTDGKFTAIDGYSAEYEAGQLDDEVRNLMLPLLNLEDDMYTDLAASVSSMMVRSYAVAIVKPAEGKTDAVREALEAYVTSEQQSMEHYLEDQYQIAKAATVTVAPTGEVILVCAENHDTLLDNIEKALAA